MNVTVVSVTSRIPDRAREPYYRYQLWHDGLTHFGCQPVVLGMGEHWQGLMTKPRRLRDWLRASGCQTEYLIVTDSYDVVFTGPPEEVQWWYEKEYSIHGAAAPIIFNAEKGIFPRGELLEAFDKRAEMKMAAGSPWKYLNSGWYIGRTEQILKMLEAFWLDDIHDDYQRPDGSWVHVNDQGWYQTIFCAQPVPMTLDYKCEIVQCCSACSLDEFDLTGPRIKNVVTGTEPLVWHFNGGSKNDLLPAMLPKWGMGHYL